MTIPIPDHALERLKSHGASAHSRGMNSRDVVNGTALPGGVLRLLVLAGLR